MSAARRRLAILVGEARSEEGFTIIELMMALLVITIAITALLYATYGGMRALTAAKERSVFLEAANAEVETLRALPYDSLVASTADPNAAAAYPGGQYQSRDGVLLDTAAHPTTQTPPAVQSTVTQSPAQGIILPYTVQRWITWTDANGGNTHVYKRIDLTLTWTEKAGVQRHLSLNSVVYPGGFGPSGSTNWYPPTAGTISASPTSRSISDGTTTINSATVTSAAQAQFTAADVGKTVLGPGIATGTKIASVQSVTSATMSANATASGSSLAISITSVTAGLTPVTFTDTGAADSAQNNPPDSSLGYTWNFGDGTAAVNGTTVASHTFPSPGSYTVQLTVSNSHDAASVATYTVNVAPQTGAAAPTASFTVDQSTGAAPLTVNFNGSTSSDPSGGSLAYSWAWGDGSSAGSGANVAHTFTSTGSFTVTLTVTDASNLTGTTSKSISTTSVSCNITSGSFNNPATNTTANDIKVSSGTPVNTSMAFTVTTNDACTSVYAGLPYSDGSFLIAPMSVASDVNGVKTWKTTTSSSKKFSTGQHQSGWVYDSVAGTSYTYQFSVHT